MNEALRSAHVLMSLNTTLQQLQDSLSPTELSYIKDKAENIFSQSLQRATGTSVAEGKLVAYRALGDSWTLIAHLTSIDNEAANQQVCVWGSRKGP